VLFILIPAALALGALGLFFFFAAVKDGQFDDLDADAVRFLQDD
jgi:cbb3-type cytochrome oxidase maturation protein